MRARRVVHALVTGAAVASVSAQAFAAADVVVPDGCGDAASFETELQSRVGEHAYEVLSKTHVRIERDGDAYRLSMRVGDESRIIQDPSCRELFVAAVVVAAAVVEGNTPRGGERATVPDGVSTAPPVSATQAPPMVPPQNPAPARPDSIEGASPLPASSGNRVAFGIGAGVGTSFGFLPKPSLAAELAAGVHFGRWGVAARGRYYASSDERDAEGRGVSVQAAGAELSASWTGWEVLELRVGANARAAFGDGIGSPQTNTDTAWSLGALAGVRWKALTLRGTSLVLGADGTVDAMRPAFEIIKYHQVFQSSSVDGAVFVGVEQMFR
jgi:hypothetical protein